MSGRKDRKEEERKGKLVTWEWIGISFIDLVEWRKGEGRGV